MNTTARKPTAPRYTLRRDRECGRPCWMVLDPFGIAVLVRRTRRECIAAMRTAVFALRTADAPIAWTRNPSQE